MLANLLIQFAWLLLAWCIGRDVAACDPSGGSRDSFTCAIAHAESDRVILDCVRERRPPFSPEAVCAEFAEVIKSYGLREVVGDRYAGEWPREQFRKHGIHYQLAPMPKSATTRLFAPAQFRHGRAARPPAPRRSAMRAREAHGPRRPGFDRSRTRRSR